MKRVCASLIVALALIPLYAAAGGVPWGEPNNTSGRFIVLSSYGNEAVFDSETGLVWEQSPGDVNGDRVVNGADKTTWGSAHYHCNDKTVGGRNGWRLPTIQELASLISRTGPSPKLPAGHPFSNVQSSFYWSATTSSSDATRAWAAFFNSGLVNTPDKSLDPAFVWCVRGGQGVDPQ